MCDHLRDDAVVGVGLAVAIESNFLGGLLEPIRIPRRHISVRFAEGLVRRRSPQMALSSACCGRAD